MEKISSETNKKFKYWLSLTESRGLKKSEHFLLSGESFIQEFLKEQAENVDCLLFLEGSEPKFQHRKCYSLDKKLFQSLDLFGTGPVLAVIKKPELDSWNQQETEGLQVLLPLGDPQNMGSFLRNAAAFGVDKIILLKEACSPFHPKALRAAAGNIRHFSFFQGPSIREIKDLELPQLFCLDMKGKDLSDLRLPKDLCLLVGEEGPGIPLEIRNKANTISIPMLNNVESLNASFSASLVSYEYFKQHLNQN